MAVNPKIQGFSVSEARNIAIHSAENCAFSYGVIDAIMCSTSARVLGRNSRFVVRSVTGRSCSGRLADSTIQLAASRTTGWTTAAPTRYVGISPDPLRQSHEHQTQQIRSPGHVPPHPLARAPRHVP